MNQAKNAPLSRRDFLKVNAASTGGFILYNSVPAFGKDSFPALKATVLSPTLIGQLKTDDAPAPINRSSWYIAENVGDGLHYTVEKGSLTQAKYLTADILLAGNNLCVFTITLKDQQHSTGFTVSFGLLNQCSARIQLPLTLVDMNRWRVDRQGAWLKPLCSGRRVDLAKVESITLKVHRKSSKQVRWCMTPISVTDKEVPKLVESILPQGKLLDEMGQSTIHSWPGKSRSTSQVTQRIKSQINQASQQKWPDHFARWGGCRKIQFRPTGFFRKEFAKNRWWLVDPDGFSFWSAGCDCVSSAINANIGGLRNALTFLPDPQGPFAQIQSGCGQYINYLGANFIRAFGPEQWKEKWSQIALAQLRRIGFNTVANWSEWQIASQAKFPYVRPMNFRPKRIKHIYRDFPDVFDPAFENDAADYAAQLSSTNEDPALIGYFMMNEPQWGFSSELPAVGMLLNTQTCHTRKKLSEFLKHRYPDNAAFAAAWQIAADFNDVAAGRWKWPLNDQAGKDLEDFSELMVECFFKTLRNACKMIDDKHMNLGIRYHTVPPKWAVKGMASFDVFSMNCYAQKIPADAVQVIHEKLNMPTMIGEFHFGALDVGLPASGIGHVKTQFDRGRAYRIYLEDAAANPYCVGVHWFTLYDQSALGRSDGENYNIGFLDICNRPYAPLCQAARKSHEALYDIAAGTRKPFTDAPEYLPKLFL